MKTEWDRTKPEIGGGCRERGSLQGGWRHIVGVSRTGITVLDNWGNGGPNFTRTIPLHDIELVSRAEVEQKRARGMFAETRDKTRFYFERYARHERRRYGRA